MEIEIPRQPARFGRCVVDFQRRRLWRDTVPIPLTAKTFDVLAFLIEHPHRVVDKEEFFAKLWPDTAVLEASLVRQISLLRKALGQRPERNDYIVTIPGRGYEFVATVEQLAELPDGLVDAAQAPAATPDETLAPIHARAVVTTLAARSTRRVEYGWALGLAMVAAVAATSFAWGKRAAPDLPALGRTLHQTTFEAGSQREPSWSPDGKTIAFTSAAAGNTDIWLREIDDPTPIRLTFDPARDSQPSWSPDGRTIAFRSERDGGGIYRVSVRGGDERQIAAFGFHPRWSSTGGLIMFSSPFVRTGPRDVYVVDADGGTPRRVAADVIEQFIAGTTSMGWLNSVNVNWHPDGARISVWGQLPNGDWQFVTVPESGGAPILSPIPSEIEERFAREGLSLGRFVWAPSGRFLYFEGRTDATQNIWRVAIDPVTLAWGDRLERLTVGASSEGDIAISADGSRIAFTARSERTRVWKMKLDPHTQRLVGSGDALTSGNAGELDLDASPDGRKLAYRTRRAGRTEVWEFDTSSRTERLLLATMDWRPTTPRWSADGRRLAYTRPQPGGTDAVVALLSPDAGDEELVNLPGGLWLVPSDWSADGTALLGSCRLSPSDSMSVCSLQLQPGQSTTSVQRLAHDTAKNLWVPRFSPGRRWVTFVAVDVNPGSTSRIYASPVAGGAWSPITDGRSFDDKPRWSPDGRTVYFMSSRNGFLNVWGRGFNPATGQPEGETFQVTAFAGQERALASQMSRLEFGVTDDGLFLPLTDTLGNIWVLDSVDR